MSSHHHQNLIVRVEVKLQAKWPLHSNSRVSLFVQPWRVNNICKERRFHNNFLPPFYFFSYCEFFFDLFLFFRYFLWLSWSEKTSSYTSWYSARYLWVLKVISFKSNLLILTINKEHIVSFVVCRNKHWLCACFIEFAILCTSVYLTNWKFHYLSSLAQLQVFRKTLLGLKGITLEDIISNNTSSICSIWTHLFKACNSTLSPFTIV